MLYTTLVFSKNIQNIYTIYTYYIKILIIKEQHYNLYSFVPDTLIDERKKNVLI